VGAGDQVTAAAPHPVLAELAHEPGVLSWRGGRYLLIRPETLAALRRAVEQAVGDRAAECFAAGGRAGGGRAAGHLTGTPRERVERLAAMGSAIGWGDFALESFTADRLVVTVRRSPFAEAHGASPHPVCDLVRGVLESLTESVFGTRWAVTEVECVAVGQTQCRFEAAPSEAPLRGS
jgi:predicted hydrocarbon binding protein